MQRLSLKVLLRFLSTYTHWNLVRRSEGYHLYFLTKESECSTMMFPDRKRGGGRGRRPKTRHRGLATHRLKKDGQTPPTVRQARIKSIGEPRGGLESSTKDVLIFSPIFETVEEAVQVGIGAVENSIIDEKSKRSSYDSLAWDDFLPYKKENDSQDDDSFDTIENSTDLDSKESTPFYLDDTPSVFGEKELDALDPYNVCVRNQADKLLKDMLQLRHEIEEMNCQVKEDENTNKNVDGLDATGDKEQEEARRGQGGDPLGQEALRGLGGPLGEQEASHQQHLRDRLETMTAEVRKEMETEHKRRVEDGVSQAQTNKTNKTNIDDDTKIRNFFQDMVEKKKTPSETNTQNTSEIVVVPTAASFNEINDSNKLEENTDKPNLEVKEEVGKKTREKREKKNSVRSPKSTEKKKSKNKVVDLLDVPFCGYNQYNNPSAKSRDSVPKDAKPKMYASLERRKKKKDLRTVLSSHDKQAAKEMLTELLELREKNKGRNNSVLDSMISIISVSSTTVCVPASTLDSTLDSEGSFEPTGAVNFRDLFHYEANTCESRGVFEKLVMNKSGESHSLQDLFPWSDREGGNLNKLKL